MGLQETHLLGVPREGSAGSNWLYPEGFLGPVTFHVGHQKEKEIEVGD